MMSVGGRNGTGEVVLRHASGAVLVVLVGLSPWLLVQVPYFGSRARDLTLVCVCCSSLGAGVGAVS